MRAKADMDYGCRRLQSKSPFTRFRGRLAKSAAGVSADFTSQALSLDLGESLPGTFQNGFQAAHSA